MKVLALVAEAFGGYGGIAQSTQDFLLALLTNEAIQSIEILPRVTGEAEVNLLPRKILQHPPRNGRLAFSQEAWKIAHSMKPELVYCGHLFLVPLAAALAKLHRAKLVLHLHGIEIWRPLTYIRGLSLAQVDMTLCVSHDTRDRLLRQMPIARRRTAVIYNTFDEAFRPGDRVAARRKLGVTGQKVILTVSRLDARQRHKGHDLIIEQMTRLRTATDDNVLYMVAGDGNDQARLQNLAARHGGEAFIRFLGRVPADALPDLYRAADLYAMPSSGEGFGIAFIEAMACGTPAIGLAVGGAPDALCDGELGVAATQAGFPDALERALASPPRKGEELARAVNAKFGLAAFRLRTSAALRPILG